MESFKCFRFVMLLQTFLLHALCDPVDKVRGSYVNAD